MDYANPQALVSTDWLAKHLNDAHVRVIDATYHLPHADRDAYEEYTYRHIPGTSYFPIDEIADISVMLPHMLPDAKIFAAEVGKMGIDNDTHVIVYDSNGGYMAAARVWWTFRVFGHMNISVLDGGLPKWTAEKHPVEDGEATPAPKTFSATKNLKLVRDRAQILANIESVGEQVIDARSPGRFEGADHEPRPTERRGHIPGSFNLPFPKVMKPKDGFAMADAQTIKAALEEIGVDLSKPITASCGSGVTASVIAFAAHLIGLDDVAIYDGSWAEWGNDPDVPIAP